MGKKKKRPLGQVESIPDDLLLTKKRPLGQIETIKSYSERRDDWIKKNPHMGSTTKRK